MNKKEIAEIKKQYTPANCAVTRICGCYVDGEKNKVAQFGETFLSLPEEEIFKYFEIFRKTLSGTLGKNLLEMEFPLETEREGGTQSRLLGLRDSGLKDETLLERFYDEIISAYSYGENYLILLVHAAYDVPGKASDRLEQFDASEEVFSYINCAICPVALAKPALSYDAAEGMFRNRIRDWVVDMPQLGFLFPAFNDRSSDIHSLLYYSKSADQLHFDLTDRLLGTTLPLPASSQKEVFADLVEDALGEACDFETVRALHDQLYELKEQLKESPDPVILDQGEVKNLLELSGAGFEQVQRFDQHFEKVAGTSDAQFLISNLAGSRKFEVKSPDVIIQVSPDRADLVEERLVDGRRCLVIPITDEIQVNGIRIARGSAGEGEEV